MNARTKYLVIGTVTVIVVVLLGLFWYLHSPEPNTSIVASSTQESTTTVWKSFTSDNDIGVSFDFPENWGKPAVYKEGDVLYLDKDYSYSVGKGQFFIEFPSSSPAVYIEGLNSDYNPGGPYASCAWFNMLRENNQGVPVFPTRDGIKLESGAVLVYGVDIHESENRYGLYGDAILHSSKKFPSLCATISLDSVGGFNNLERVVSEKLPPIGYNKDGNEDPVYPIRASYSEDNLPSEYLKGLNLQTRKVINNFERFADSLKTYNSN